MKRSKTWEARTIVSKVAIPDDAAGLSQVHVSFEQAAAECLRDCLRCRLQLKPGGRSLLAKPRWNSIEISSAIAVPRRGSLEGGG
jgi:hypothetical protein